MKSLLDLQKKVKELELSIRDAANRLDDISKDIQELRNYNDDMEIDYEMIKTLSQNMPFKTHPLARLEDAYACMIYIELLLYIVQLDNHGIVEKMTFIQWILTESQLDLTLQDAYLESLVIGKDIFSEAASLLNTAYRSYWTVDALLVSNFVGQANTETTEYIAQLCTIFNLTGTDVSIYSVMAKVVLCQDAGMLDRQSSRKILPTLKKYRHYLSIEYDEEILYNIRDICVEVSDNDLFRHDSNYFRWIVKQGEYVKEGQLIATWIPPFEHHSGFSISLEKENHKILIYATSSGILFQFRNKCTNYGVISDRKDDKDSIKAWVQKIRG